MPSPVALLAADQTTCLLEARSVSLRLSQKTPPALHLQCRRRLFLFGRVADNRGMNESQPIQITVNGEARRLPAGSAVTDLIAQLELAETRLAIELNQDILPRAKWAETRLQAGDRLEIVHFVGGG
jgi:sulfur carrier protein